MVTTHTYIHTHIHIYRVSFCKLLPVSIDAPMGEGQEEGGEMQGMEGTEGVQGGMEGIQGGGEVKAVSVETPVSMSVSMSDRASMPVSLVSDRVIQRHHRYVVCCILYVVCRIYLSNYLSIYLYNPYLLYLSMVSQEVRQGSETSERPARGPTTEVCMYVYMCVCM
jgi:hypothetical protein